MKFNSLVFILIALIIVGGVIWLLAKPQGPGQYDTFAQCLSDKGAKFFGAWWCPHCRDQKALFGASAKVLPYVECYAPGRSDQQLPVCEEAGIKSFPTWQFADGSSETGTLTFQQLADKTSCEI